MTDRLLTLHDAVNLSTIVDAAITGARVRWLDEASGDVRSGTARSIGRGLVDGASFLTDRDDVRDGFLRVTTDTGWEAFLPVADLVPMVRETTFVIDRQ